MYSVYPSPPSCPKKYIDVCREYTFIQNFFIWGDKGNGEKIKKEEGFSNKIKTRKEGFNAFEFHFFPTSYLFFSFFFCAM